MNVGGCSGLCYAVTLAMLCDRLSDTLASGDNAMDLLRGFMDLVMAPEGFESLQSILRSWP